MTTIVTRRIINAAPSVVWAALTDFASFPGWNPLVTQAAVQGGRTLAQNETLDILIADSSGSTTRFTPRVLACQENEELRWKGGFFSESLLSGEHYFRLVNKDDGTTELEHGEIFGGLIGPLMNFFLGDDYKNQFNRMNDALADRCITPEATAVVTGLAAEWKRRSSDEKLSLDAGADAGVGADISPKAKRK